MNSQEILITFVAASAIGYLMVLISSRVNISQIVLLLISGVLVGPEFLNLVRPESLGYGLSAIVSLAVGIILFEGGMTLDFKGYRQVSSEIRGVLTWGVLITWFGSASLLYFFFRFDVAYCLLGGSLIIVTGPTVVGPLLQRLRVIKPVTQILYWEGVLIDPIGVFCSLLTYEWIITAGGQDAYLNFFKRIIAGLVFGWIVGFVLDYILRKRMIQEEKINFFMLTSAMAAFAISDYAMHESGLLCLTVAGLYIGYKKSPGIHGIIAYKSELKDYLIGLLFILLAANLKLNSFIEAGENLFWVILGVMFLIRPLNILVSTFNSKLGIKEKVFLSWIAPRGIVAASMASLFSIQLSKIGLGPLNFLEAFTYGVIAATVLFQGFSAKYVAQILGLREKQPDGWLLIGSNPLTRAVAHYLKNENKSHLLIDTNLQEVKLAQQEGLNAILENAMRLNPERHLEIAGLGNLIAATANEELNRLVCQRFSVIAPKLKRYYWPGHRDEAPVKIGKSAPVWGEFSLKNIQAQTGGAELITCISEITAPFGAGQGHALLYDFKGKLSPFPPGDKDGVGKVLVVTPQAVSILEATKGEWILFSNARSLEALFKEMLSLLDERFYQVDKLEVVQKLLEQEKEFSSLIGHAVALPHCYQESLEESILLVAVLKEPLVCQGAKEDIQLVFMLMSPAGHPEKHLQALGKIAKFAIDEKNRTALINASDEAMALEILENGAINHLE
ncbi:MAG: cation:proton antiporter [SAR324 cluster bacterium]|nr:cation:proton antiporter [SAR324 cluster bacterium]